MTHDAIEAPRPSVADKPAGGPAGPKLRLVEPSHVRWVETALLIVALGVVAYFAASIAAQTGAEVPAVVRPAAVATVAAVLAGIVTVTGWRTNRRRDDRASLNNQVNARLKLQLDIRSVRWRRRQPQEIRLRYPAHAEVVLGGMVGASIARVCSTVVGKPLRVRASSSRRRSMVLTQTPDDSTADQTVEERESARVVAVVREAFGTDAKVDGLNLEEADQPGAGTETAPGGDVQVTEFTVQSPSAAKLTSKSVQAKTVNAVAVRLPGKWSADFQLTEDRVVFRRRKPLPVRVLRECTPISPDDPDWEHIPQAVVAGGTVEKWDISGVMAHHLKAGKTRTGKTVSLIGDCLECARRGMQVFIVDPKWVEFLGLRGWPNVRIVGMSVQEQIVIIYYLYNLMYERYRMVKEGEAAEADFQRILLILDEYRQFYGEVQSWWKSIKISGMPAECPVFEWVGSLLRMAAAARIHVDLGTQRPDAEFLKGELRDNFSARSATGRLTPDGSQMMFESQKVATTIPVHIRGRGTTTGLDDNPREAQFLYTPDPRKATDPEDLELLSQFWDDTEQVWGFLEVRFPTDEEAAEEVANTARKTVVEWEAILNAELVEAEPPPLVRPNQQQTEANPAPSQVSSPDPVGEAVDETLPEDPYSGYAEACSVQPHLVQVGDLVEGEGSDDWVVVTDVEPDGEGQIKISWRDDYGLEGEHWTSDEELVVHRSAPAKTH